MRILIADDDTLMRKMVSTCLRGMAEIREAGDGVKLFSLLKQEKFDLLLLDWDMPAPNGLEVLKILRKRGYDIPVVMVTAAASRPQVVEALAAGASDYLIKPFEAAVLQAKVSKFSAATVSAQG